MKKIRSLGIISILCVLMLCIGLFAACSTEPLEYTEYTPGYSVKAKNTDISGDIIIPSEYNGRPVFSIDVGAFKDCTKITSVTIPNSVEKIQDQAFQGCQNCEIIIPTSVTYLGFNSFSKTSNCSITYQGTKAEYNSNVKGQIPPNEVVVNCTDGVWREGKH